MFLSKDILTQNSINVNYIFIIEMLKKNWFGNPVPIS
jgi:hypothetical protein